MTNRTPDEQFNQNHSGFLDLNSSNHGLMDTSQNQSPEGKKKTKTKLGLAGKILGGQGQSQKEKQTDGGFFLSQTNLDAEDSKLNLVQGSNLNSGKFNANGFFLGKMLNQAKNIEDRLEIAEKNRMKLSSDPYEVFYAQDRNYPVKEDEMTFMDKFCSEHMQGMPSLPTGKCALFCNLICWFYLLIFGVVFLVISKNITQYSIDYGIACQGQEICWIKLQILQGIPGPLFVYYQMSEFYQSHSDFASSIIPFQMAGGDISQQQINKNCRSASNLTQMGINAKLSAAGYIMDYTQIANPCGIAAKYYFNDTYSLFDVNLTRVFINETNISSYVDRTYKYNRHPDWQFRQWLDVQDEHVMNWFNIQSLPLVRKLWGIIPNEVSPGNYTVVIRNEYDINLFGGEKTLIFTTLSSFGSKNYVFGLLLIGTSFLQLISGIFIYRKHLSVQRKYIVDRKVYMDPYNTNDKKKSE